MAMLRREWRSELTLTPRDGSDAWPPSHCSSMSTRGEGEGEGEVEGEGEGEVEGGGQEPW